MTLDPYMPRQLTLWLDNLYLEVFTVHSDKLRMFWINAFPLLKLLMWRIISQISSRINFNFFSQDVVWLKNRTHYLPCAEKMDYSLFLDSTLLSILATLQNKDHPNFRNLAFSRVFVKRGIFYLENSIKTLNASCDINKYFQLLL